MKNGRIAGTGSYVPETIWKNEDLEKMVETSDIWIRERTGIGARHIAGEETVAQIDVYKRQGCDPLPVYGKNVSEKGHWRSTVRDQKPLISSRSRSIEG